MAASDPPALTTLGRADAVTTELRYTFDRGETFAPRSRVADVSRHGNHGTVRLGNGRLREVERQGGSAVRFPCNGCGRALITAPDAAFLDPGLHSFRFGARLRAFPRQAPPGRDPNVVQKGFQHQKGGRWKLELVGARPQCTVTGPRGELVARSTTPLDDGAWHRLVCQRKNGRLTLFTDGTSRAQVSGPTGRINNGAAVKVGGKALGRAGSDDQFHGSVDDVFVTVARR